MAKMKILLVDDELEFLELAAIRLNSWGYEVVTASNGKEALEAVKEKKADMIILDYLMPDMDGIEVLRQLRKFDKKIPVVMLTAHPDIKSMKGAEELGISCYTPKLSDSVDTQKSLKSAIEMVEDDLKLKG